MSRIGTFRLAVVLLTGKPERRSLQLANALAAVVHVVGINEIQICTSVSVLSSSFAAAHRLEDTKTKVGSSRCSPINKRVLQLHELLGISPVRIQLKLRT